MYQYCFVYYKKAVIDDDKAAKMIYRDLNKKSRRIVGAFILYLIITLSLIFAEEEAFLRCVWKGAVLAAIIIPSMNSYYGDKKRFKFTF